VELRFADGDQIHSDGRREDPLYYYLINGSWERAIGFSIDPLYGEHEATDVSSRVFASHTTLLTALDDVTLRRLLVRVVKALTDVHPRWRTWAAEFPVEVHDRLGESALRGLFEVTNWDYVESEGTTLRFRRRAASATG
jgi:hypothetical protein